jgi:RHS repeat-associated protein
VEYPIYGLTREGIARPDTNIYYRFQDTITTRWLGQKSYELTDQLGNVRATISDIKLPTGTPGSGPYKADFLSYMNPYPFGMPEPGRFWEAKVYRYGYDGMERDDELKGAGESYATEYRMFDPRVGRWLSTDPMTQYAESPYVGLNNNPVRFLDPLGLDATGGDEAPSNPLNPNTSSSTTPPPGDGNAGPYEPSPRPPVVVTGKRVNGLFPLEFYGDYYFDENSNIVGLKRNDVGTNRIFQPFVLGNEEFLGTRYLLTSETKNSIVVRLPGESHFWHDFVYGAAVEIPSGEDWLGFTIKEKYGIAPEGYLTWPVPSDDPVPLAIPAEGPIVDLAASGLEACFAKNGLRAVANGFSSVSGVSLGAAGEAADHIALGIADQGLEVTAKQIGARHLLDDVDWKNTLLKAITNRNTKFTLILDGFDGGSTYTQIMRAAQRGMTDLARATDWEVAQLYRADRLGDVTLMQNGKVIPNPFAQ